MKKFAILVMLLSASIFANAQSGSAEFLGNPAGKDGKSAGVKTQTVKAEPKKGPFYNCGQCAYSDNKTGQCPSHKFELVKEGQWHCPMNFDNGVGETEGHCPKCGMQMIKMEFRNHKEAEASNDSKTK